MQTNNIDTDIIKLNTGDHFGPDQLSDPDMLRLRREWVNEAIEYYGYDLVKIQEYVSRRSVA